MLCELTAAPLKQPDRQWRKFLPAVGASTASYVAINIADDSDSVAINIADDNDSAATNIDDDSDSAPADENLIKCLIKKKRHDCFRRFGRKEAFGGNTYRKPKTKSFFDHFLDAFKDFFVASILLCAAVSLGFGIREHGLKDGWYDGASIFLAVFVGSGVSAAGSHRQAKRDDKLGSESPDIGITVVRASRRQEVSVFDVVGDVVIQNIGDAVPADGVFLEGHGLQVDESSLTGHPDPVEIDAEKNPFLASGVKVVDGHGSMLVTAVHSDTDCGEVSSSLSTLKTDPAPLQERLEGLTSTIGNIGASDTVLMTSAGTGSAGDRTQDMWCELSAAPMKQPDMQWRKFLPAVRASTASSYVAINIDDDSDSAAINIDGDSDSAAINIDDDSDSAAADENLIKCLVKQKHLDCFRRLGRSAGIAAKLTSDAECGISGCADDVRRRKEAFGGNTYRKPKTKSFFGHFLDVFKDFYLVGILVCAAVSLGFGIKEHGLKDGWYDGASIFLAVFVVSGVSAAGSHRQAKRDDKLGRESADIAVTVVRTSRRQEVSVFDVVVGDVVILNIGDAVPADGVFLEGHGLQVDESSLTGHPDPVDIDAEKNPFLASGVKVVDGHGSMLVTAVGSDTDCGQVSSSLSTLNNDPAPLQERLEGLTSTIGNIGAAVAVVAFTVLAARHLTGNNTGKPPLMDKAVPLAVTLMLTFSMRRMVKHNARLSALETMGFVTAICTDKTGTLTLRQMEVTEFWVGTAQPRDATVISNGVVSLLCQGVGLNTTGSVYRPDNVSPPEISGSPTEKALLSWAVAYLAMDADELKRSCKVLHMEVFNSVRKNSGVMTRDRATGAVVVHRKGAAELILASCSMYVDIDGAACELVGEQRTKLEKVINDMAAGGLRCIAFAYKQVDGTEQSKIAEEGLTLLGLVGLKDPCRPEVKAAIEACTKAGVAVRMVTGDNILTARAIAIECGIMSSNDPDDVIIEGHEFRAMSTDRLLNRADKIRVMARSQPQDKVMLVRWLKQNGVVAVTNSDGTNDALALKEANVVLSMGVQGTDITKDTIILNDKFDTVVTATRWGRWAYDNFQKFIQFYLTINVVAIVVNFVPAITTGNIPLTTQQLLWVNLVMGAMMALSTDKPTDALMDRPPIACTAPLISNAMWRNVAVQAAFQIVVLLALQYLGTYDEANGTMIFNVFMLCQVFNEFNMRDIKKKNILAGVIKNRMFLVIVTLTLVLQVVTVDVLTRFTGTKKLDLGQWGVCVAIAAVSWPIGWVVKFIPMPVGSMTSLA